MELRNYVVLIKRLALLALIYTLTRLLFFIFNYENFQDASTITLIKSFLLGFRFDLAAICLINVLFILFSIIPLKRNSSSGYQQFLKVLFLICNIPFILLNLIDIEYYKFKGKRTTLEILGIAGDIGDQIMQLSVHYWYIGVMTIVLVYAIVRFYPKLKLQNNSLQPLTAWKTYPAMLVIVSLGFVSFRGVGLKPIRPSNAFVFNPNQMGNLVLNTPFLFLLSADMKGVEKVSYFKDPEQAISLIRKKSVEETEVVKKDNVVIIILESFAGEYMGAGNSYKGYTPFLDSLSSQGLFFRKNFANGRQSIHALPSIFASIPSLMDEPYSTSIYQTNKIYGLGSYLLPHGYHTSFFHGGKNGTMGFDAFAQNAGFTEYYGLNEYPQADKDFDGNWGIFDEPFLQFFCSKLNQYKQPFLSGVFSLSSHQPYTIPEHYKGKFPKGELPIHESIGYADYALRKFFETASRQEWYKNTLFIITADHTQENSKPEYQHIIGQHNVPLILFHPNQKLQADTSQVTQHADILPSVLDYLNVPYDKPLYFGRSVFDSSCAGEALTYLNGSYLLSGKDYFLEFSALNGSRLFDFNKDKSQKLPLSLSQKADLENKLKAYIQYYNNGLIENNWYTFSSVKGEK